MHYFLCLSIEQFYVRNQQASELELDPTRPHVVFAKKAVLDSNTPARLKKVFPGTPLAQAKALLDNAQYTEWNPDDYKVAQNEWLSKLPLFSSVIEPGKAEEPAQHIAFVDLSAHNDPSNLVSKLVDQIQQPLRWGAAQTKWLSQLAMRFDAYDVAVQQPHALLNLLPIQELTPVLPEHRERLSFLGYPTVGAVANLPHRVLFAQFGKESIRIAAAAKGELFEPIKALYPERSLNFHFRFESGVFDRQAFDEAFKQLSHEAGKQLSTMECQAHSFQLIAEGETKFFVLSKALQKPISTTTACRVALGLLDLTSIDEQIVSFRLLVENLQKRKRIQRELNYQALGDSELDKQSKSQLIQQTVQSVHKNHGLNSLKLASEIMIPREQQVIRQWEKALGTRRI